jgi:sensor histidine kinase YesM
MDNHQQTLKKSRFPYIYELFIWVIYVCLYKYSFYVEEAPIPHGMRVNFPYPQLILYSIGMTLYTIPFYRWLAPLFMRKRKYGWFFLIAIFYFAFVSKWMGWLVSIVFYAVNTDPVLSSYYQFQYLNFGFRAFKVAFWDINILVTDLIAFLSLTFTWFAFENERKKFQLEKDNLLLQLDSLKAQLHPHFLFNTLNNIYGMSLTGNKETPAFILRLSDMMRFILYDCQQNKVTLEKDIEFLENYLEMEKKRYPAADIQFTVSGDATGKHIAPLLFIQFLENSFKHGAHRLNDTGFIHGSLTVAGPTLSFELRNDVFAASPLSGPTPGQLHGTVPGLLPGGQLPPALAGGQYGGVGIENVRRRLDLYYPGKHNLIIDSGKTTFEVKLTITLS